MKDLIIIQQDDKTFVAGSSTTSDEMHGMTGSIYDLWHEAKELIKDSEGMVEFDFRGFTLHTSSYHTEFNTDLNGYVLTFADGSVAQTQLETLNNPLHAFDGDEILYRYEEWDTELTEEQHEQVDDFVEQINRIIGLS